MVCVFDVYVVDKIGKNRGSVQIVNLFYFIFLKISVFFSELIAPYITLYRRAAVDRDSV